MLLTGIWQLSLLLSLSLYLFTPFIFSFFSCFRSLTFFPSLPPPSLSLSLSLSFFLHSSLSFQIRIVGIPIEEIVDGNKKLTLGLVWMLILNFQVPEITHACTHACLLLYIHLHVHVLNLHILFDPNVCVHVHQMMYSKTYYNQAPNIINNYIFYRGINVEQYMYKYMCIAFVCYRLYTVHNLLVNANSRLLIVYYFY